MKAEVDGYRYQLDHLEGDGCSFLQFIHKERESETSEELRTITNGTTNEEVLRVLIDRLRFQNKRQSCRENSIVITKLEESLMWLERRTADREARGVEGTAAK